MGKIGASASAKINRGNYQSEDFSMWVEHEVSTDDPEELIEEAKELQKRIRIDLWANITETGGME